jgi:4a-hydroxytetrahydrobiopterin dehydratase
MEKLSQDMIDERLAALPEWSQTGDSLQRTFTFDDFVAAFEFVKRLADYAEVVQHHPDILVRYNKVTLTLSTHDAGGLTAKDFDFADEMDAYFAAAH